MTKLLTALFISIALLVLILTPFAVYYLRVAKYTFVVSQPPVEQIVTCDSDVYSLTENVQGFEAVTNEMLDYMIMCESSGNNEAIGEENEQGILQFKQSAWSFLSKKFNFVGDIHNEQDQKDLFLLAVMNGYAKWWTCYNKFLTTK